VAELVDGEDWRGRALDGDTFTDVTFLEADLSEVATASALFDGCSFKGVRLNGSVHRASAFVNCTFLRSSFFDASFAGCKLVGSSFEKCTFELLKVEGGDWSFVSLAAADLRSARFEDVRMRESDLTDVKAAGATLTGLDLSAALLLGADLTGADLRRSDLSALDPAETKVVDAIVTFDQAVNVARGLGFDVRAD
jgi:uncharacterized protein YjbI with pentapeptide repeats